MSDVREVCEEVHNHIPEILRDWEDLTREQPWLALPREAKLDHLPELLRSLISVCTCAKGDLQTRERAIRTAMEHGVQRREQGLDDDVLFREYHLLREALWQGMRRRHPGDPRPYEAIARIDAAITVATRGSLEGFHGRDENERVVRELVETGPWPRSS